VNGRTMAISEEARRNHQALFGKTQFERSLGFGDYSTRTGLDLKTRELLTFIGYPRSLNALRLINERTSP